MSRSRTIKPSFFLNEQLAECSPFARLMFAGLWCIADRDGRVEDRPRRVKAWLFPYDDVDADRLLSELHSAGFITRYCVDGVKCIQVTNFRRHQNPHPREAKSELPPMSREKVLPCNEKALTSNDPLGRGVLECKEEECKEEEKQEEATARAPTSPATPFFRPPDVDGTTDSVLLRFGEINAEAKRTPIVNPSAKDRDKLSEAICLFGRKRCENLWHWSINSPHPRAKFYRAKGMLSVRQLFDPEKVGELIELSEANDAWAAEIREGPADNYDAIEAQIKAAIDANSKPGPKK